MLFRSADEVVLSYDSDEAGQKATERSLGILGSTTLKVSVLSVFIRLLRFGTSSVRRGMSAGSSAQRECPSICAGNPSATLPNPG